MKLTYGLFVLALGLAPCGETAVSAGRDCDRDCLEDLTESVLKSMVANDPSRLKTTPDVRYTENGQPLALGDALWATADGLGDYRLHFADPVSGQAAFFGIVGEHGRDVLMALRLRVENRRIAEIETIVLRNPGGDAGQAVAALAGPNPLWGQAVPEDERMSRGDLIRTANMYFSGMENNDGRGEYPFADDCNRLENGNRTTNNPDIRYGEHDSSTFNFPAMGCKAQFETGYLSAVTRIRDRRFPLVDVERGVVLSFAFFDHNATVREAHLTNGMVIPFNLRQPFTWEVGEAFKIEKGKIRFIEAVLRQAPYGMDAGWED